MSDLDGARADSAFGSDAVKAYGAITSSIFKELQSGRARNPGNVVMSEKLDAQQELIDHQAKTIEEMKRELEYQTQELTSYRSQLGSKCEEFSLNVNDVLKAVGEFIMNCNEKHDTFVTKLSVLGDKVVTLTSQNTELRQEVSNLTQKLAENALSISAHSEESSILLNQIEAKNKECRALQQESDKWKEANEQMRSRLEDSEAKLDSMTKALETSRIEKEELEKAIQDLRRKEQEHEVMQKVSQQESDEMKSRLEASENQVASLTEQLKISKATEESLQQQIEEQKTAFGNAQQSGNQLANELVQLQSKKSALEAENVELKIALESASHRESSLKMQLEKEIEKSRENNDMIEALRIEKSRLSEKSEVQNNTIVEMKSEHTTEILKLKEQLQEKDDEIGKVRSEMEKLVQEKDGLFEELQQREGTYKQSQEELMMRFKELETENDNLGKDKLAIEREKNNAQKLSESLQAKVQELEDTVNSNFGEIDRLNQINQTLKVNGNDLKMENERLAREVSYREELNRSKSEAVTALESEVEELKHRIELMNVEIKNKQMENDLLSESSHSETQFREEVISLRSQLNLVNDEKASLEKKMQDYRQLQARLKAQELALEKTELLSNNLKLVTAEKDVLKSERQELLSIASAFNLEIFDLKDHFTQLEVDNRTMKSEIARLLELNEANEANIAALEEAKSTVDDNLESMKNRNSSIHQLLSRENEELRQRISTMKETLEHGDEQMATLKKELRTKESLIMEMKNEMENMQRKLSEPSEANTLAEHVKILSEENAKKFAQIEFLTSKLNKLQEENDIMYQTIDKSEEQAKEITHLVDEVRLLGSEKLEMLQIIGPLNSEIYDLRQGLADFGKSHRELKREATNLRIETQRLASENVMLRSSLSEAEAQYARVCNEIENKTKELSFLRKSTSESTEDLKKEIVAIYSELNERRQKDGLVSATAEERDMLLRDISALEVHIYNLERAHDEESTKNHQLLQRITELQSGFESQKETWMTALESLENEKKEYRAIIARKNEEISELSSQSNVKELERQLRMANTEKEMFMKRLSVNQEVDEAITRITAELGEWKEKASQLERERDSLIQESARSSQDAVASVDEEFVHKLEYENIELSSKVSLLEAQLQLKSVMQKDSAVCALEQQLKSIAEEKSSLETQLQTANAIRGEFDKLRDERDSLELRCTELEHKLSVVGEERSEVEQLRAQCERLQKEHDDVESLKDKINSLELRSEELDYNLEEQKKRNSELVSQLQQQTKANEEMKAMLSDLEIRANKTDVTNLQNKSQIVKKQVEISELESMIRVMKTEKMSLLATIEEMNRRHQEELLALSKHVPSNSSGSSPQQQIEIVAALNQRNADLTQEKIRLSIALSNEAADHLETKKRFDEQHRSYNALVRKYRDIQADHSLLVNTLTEQFSCLPTVASIIGAAAPAARVSKEWKLMKDQLTSKENELQQAKYQLAQTKNWLEIERKKLHLEETRRKNGSATTGSSLLSECVIQFLTNVVSNTVDMNVKAIASVLLANVSSNATPDSEMWTHFAEEVSGSKRIRMLTERLEQISNGFMSHILDRISETQNRCESVLARVKFSLTKQKKTRPKETKHTASLYERSLRPRVPARELAATPSVSRQKGLRIPLSAIGNSRGGVETPWLNKRIQLQTARHEMPSGVYHPLD